MNAEESPTPERKETDRSLRTERDKTDRELAKAKAIVEADADAIVRLARANADAVLNVARELADEQQAQDGSPQHAPSTAIAGERAVEDQVLRAEREVADKSLRTEREASASILARHLPFERDVTDKHLLLERARSDEALGNRDDFLAMVCHDLRDLLNGIVMSSAVLSKKALATGGSQSVQAETERIQRYGVRMNRLIADLVDVASIDAGKLAVVPTDGNAAALVAEVIDALHGAATAKGLTLGANRLEASVLARFDHDRVLQVLANIVVNAIKFTAHGGSIVIECKLGEDGLSFSVADTGQGIPDNMLEAVFERFWQVGQNDRRGLGLGLYISRCIVEAHGGTIHVESSIGQGSRFVFTLPDGARMGR